MKISGTNNLEFKSNIYVISPEAFYRLKKRMDKNPLCENITNWFIRPDIDVECFNGEKYWYAYRENVLCGSTDGIRTCTGGITIDKGKKAPLFWHILNCETNSQNLSLITDKIKGTNVFMIGAKKGSPYSVPNFEYIYNKVLSKSIPMTAFKGLSPFWEAHVAYSSINDTIYLCVSLSKNPYLYIKDLKGLKSVFDFVQISTKDKLKFLSPLQELILRYFKRI